MIKLYDTKQRRKVDFIPREEGKVSMYVCGPTVYNRIHLGNARTFISFDMIRRYFEWRGYNVTFVQNVTDVDDKIIAKASEEGRSAADVAKEYTEAFIADMHAAGVAAPTIRPKATEEIDAMIALVQKLIDKGHAYAKEGDVYFDVRSDAHYGSLSGRNIDEMEAGHRELRADGKGVEDRKRDPLDFALWKAAKPGEPSWESPWGLGRPGWHIECSAMSEKYLGLPIDIHGGGADLIFPHHENECAQSECAYDGAFSRYWMHSGMLQINSEKMSKSLGNFLLLHQVLEEARPLALRMLMLQTHYRSPLDFSMERIDEANAALSRIETALENMAWLCKNAQTDAPSVLDEKDIEAVVEQTREDFTSAMDDDFNAPAALGCIFTLVGHMNTALAGKTLSDKDAVCTKHASNLIKELLGVLGMKLEDKTSASYPEETISLAADMADYTGENTNEALSALIEARTSAKAAKDWGKADAIRDGLIELGFIIEDTPQGAKVTYAG
ncbi:cysteine--tRNA ligase [Adlercreutzia sp. ZJ154]|uniref:cysteine--tRNA ligase n=1 Tax=Adlercreutzia sp. ZJ154 TaxID=2709790 RepID=UPI0013EBAE6F|nr:cysteine--tRNA ligase [Adlercreutzia sp. ZJ154]